MALDRISPTMTQLPPATILVVEGSRDQADRYRRLARARHTVDFAASVTEANRLLTDEHDIVFVAEDRAELTPATVKRRTSGDGKIALITDTAPTTDVYQEGYDGYVVRPVGPLEFDETVRNLLARTHYANRVDEHLDLATRLAEIETARREGHDGQAAFRTHKRRLQELEDEIEGLFQEVCAMGRPVEVFYDLDSNGQADPSATPPSLVN